MDQAHAKSGVVRQGPALRSAGRRMAPRAGGTARARFAVWALLFLAVLVYSSTIVGPSGFHYVPMDAQDAWARLLASTWVEHGSDQRADWMSNVVLLVPLGFLLSGALVPQGGIAGRLLAAVGAVALGLAAVLGIKYLQLFFPPRTVTLNYIVAQSAGLLIGVLGYLATQDLLAELKFGPARAGRRELVLLLGAYSALICIFSLTPFDFVLSLGDWQDRLVDLYAVLLGWPGEGRPFGVRVLLVLVGAASFAPVGALMALQWRRLGLAWIGVIGLAAMTLLTLLTILVLSGSPRLVSILYRTAGIVFGAAAAPVLAQRGLGDLRRFLPRLALLLVLPYLLVLAYASGLLTTHWLSFDAAVAQTEARFYLPLFVFYIVTKANAAASIGIHVLMYVPVGLMLWMARGSGRGAAWTAAILAALVSAAVEFGRFLQPGLAPDCNMVVVAGIAAYGTTRLLGFLVPSGGIADTRASTWSRAPDERFAPSEWPREPEADAPASFRSPSSSRWEQFAATRRLEATTGRPAPPVRRIISAAQVTGWLVAFPCLALTLVGVANYPVLPVALWLLLAGYGVALWRWPGLWLAVVPAVLPAFDLAPWTGWSFVGEPDFFVLVTIGVLVLRTPPASRDMWPPGLRGWVLAFAAFACAVGVLVGLTSGITVPGGTSNPYLMPENALRLAKPLVTALALLPFLRLRMRTHGDAVTWFAWGMVAGLLLVGAAAVLERAMFSGVFDFTSDYRVVATFASMHVGGGHVGAYVAMAMPFLIVGLVRRRPLPVAVTLLAGTLATYTLVVTFARMAYGAALVGVCLTAILYAVAIRRRANGAPTGRVGALLLPAIFVLAIGGAVGAAVLGTGYMAGRVAEVSPDLQFREANWRNGMAMRDDDLLTDLVGMGLGSYSRVAFVLRLPGTDPSSFVVEPSAVGRELVITGRSDFFFGQKVRLGADPSLRLQLAVRSDDAKAGVAASLCWKLLLYSQNCQTVTIPVPPSPAWQQVSVTIPTTGLIAAGPLSPPVDFSLSIPEGTSVGFRDIRLLDAASNNLLVNGDFSRGTNRWFFTDDNHWRWRIFNQYLMTFFEGGVLELAAFIGLLGFAVHGAIRAVRRGDAMGAAIVGSLLAFASSCLVDSLLEAPRLASVFYIQCLAGLTIAASWQRRVVPRGT